MKRLFVLFASLFLFTVILSAQNATVTYVKGKVEVQRNGKWLALSAGDSVQINEVINTGFQSEAKIKLMDSVMFLGPVTRITLEELSASETQDKVNVYLSTGSVRSKVNHTETKRVNYTVHTAVAVASVRGTDWWINSNNEAGCTIGGFAFASKNALRASGSETSFLSDSAGLPKGGTIIGKNQYGKIKGSGYTKTQAVNETLQASNLLLSSIGTQCMKDAAESGVDVSNFRTEVIDTAVPTAKVVIKFTFVE